MRRPPTLAEVDAELARRSLAEFTKQAWPQVDPAPLIWGWHLDALCEHLQAVSLGQIRHLIIEIPPGHAKSMTASVIWPAWDWINHPERALMTGSYDHNLAIRDAVKSRLILDTDWYQSNFVRGTWEFSSDQNVKSYYRNTKLGTRQALSVAGAGTGWRGDILVVDDALNATDAYSDVSRAAAKRWFTETMSSRFNDQAKARKVVIGQRLHEDDLTGFLKRQGGWEVLTLPSEFEVNRRCVTYFRRSPEMEREEFWRDPRTTEGELLFPEKFPPEVLEEAKTPGKGMGEYAYAAQHQQRPAPAAGGIFKKDWWRFWRWEEEDDLPGLEDRTEVLSHDVRWDQVVISADCAFKKTSDSDLIAIGTWGIKGPRKYLLALSWERMGYIATKAAIRAAIETAPRRPDAVLIEDKANGPAVIEELKQDVEGVIAIEPEGGKEARAHASSPTVEAGDVHLRLHHEKRQAYIDEHATFPKGTHDDAVDMQSQLLNWLKKGGSVVILVG